MEQGGTINIGNSNELSPVRSVIIRLTRTTSIKKGIYILPTNLAVLLKKPMIGTATSPSLNERRVEQCLCGEREPGRIILKFVFRVLRCIP